MHHTSRRMTDERVKDELGAVLARQEEWAKREAEELAAWTEANRESWTEEENAAKYNAEKRRQAEKRGDALPGGKFPIVDQEDVKNAMSLVGNSSVPKSRVIAHIKKQVRKHGLKLPPSLQGNSSS